VLEGVVRGVRFAAVELDDQALLRPRAVDLHPLDADVGHWAQKTGIKEEGLEALLEFAADDAEAALCLVDEHPRDRRDGFPRVALNEIAQPQRVSEPELLGLPQGATQLVALNDSTEVKERAGHGRDRDAEVSGGLVRRQVGIVKLNARPRLPPARNGDLGPAPTTNAPQGRSGAMAQNRAGTAGENGGHPEPAPRQEAATDDGVHAPMHPVQPTHLDSVADRPASKTKL